ncbi:MAG: glycosyltransferase [Gammaproteobacteria bacterium]|nr:glycosyltransferase [Gammaproteobacteria bacterium]
MLRRITHRIKTALGRQPQAANRAVVSLLPAGKPLGNVLLSYVIDPFLRGPAVPISDSHTHHWESFQIAQTFLNHGYAVDVVSYMNSTFVPQKRYNYFIAARTQLERIARSLNRDCVIVAHLDTAHWITSNCSAYARLLDLKNRRHTGLKNSIKLIEANLAIEHAHLATVLGNDYTIDTYHYAGTPIFRIPISTTAVYDWDPAKDFEQCRKNYLWFGSSGFVHKGLDLVLEAFARMPDHHLTVCGPLDEEKEFVAIYRRELYETRNIHAEGWVDVNGHRFREITAQCAGLVYPSCAEGGGGSAITCMHAGIVPLLSREASVDLDDECGVLLRDTSVAGIMDAVKGFSNLPADKLQQMARNAWTRARATHTRERFAVDYDRFVSEVLLPKSFGRQP